MFLRLTESRTVALNWLAVPPLVANEVTANSASLVAESAPAPLTMPVASALVAIDTSIPFGGGTLDSGRYSIEPA